MARAFEGLLMAGNKKAPTVSAVEAVVRPRRALGLDIPRRVASPQSPTPFLQITQA